MRNNTGAGDFISSGVATNDSLTFGERGGREQGLGGGSGRGGGGGGVRGDEF